MRVPPENPRGVLRAATHLVRVRFRVGAAVRIRGRVRVKVRVRVRVRVRARLRTRVRVSVRLRTRVRVRRSGSPESALGLTSAQEMCAQPPA